MKTADPTRVAAVGESTMRTMPATRVSGEVTACSQPAQLRLDLGDDGRELLAEVVHGVGGWVAASCLTWRIGVRSMRSTVPAPDDPLTDSSRIGAAPVRATLRPWARFKDATKRVVYPAYEARLVRQLRAGRLPQHVGVMLDGNRRWATAAGADTAAGHRAGAANISPFLGWCEELGIEVVTLWLLSTDNLNRPAEELAPLLGIIEDVVTELAAAGRWRHQPGRGARPAARRRPPASLKDAADATRDVDGVLVNIAVGYGGRREIADAVRSLLQHHAEPGHLDRGARRASSTSSTSPSTSTPRASPTPTW